MGDHHYSLPDLRQLVAGRTHFSGVPLLTEPFFVQTSRNNNNYNNNNNILVPPHTHYHYQHHHHNSEIAAAAATAAAPAVAGHEIMLANNSLVKLPHDHYCNNNAAAATTTSGFGAAATFFGVEMEGGWINNGNDVGNNSRWPRQETLTLLEIRSRLDSRFKEANQKGPLWDEVSRIMAEEHGYQRSGKKCREKFENLYKYYKKTKDGKAGRQDGKHYRFFRQLEALYGDTTASNQQLASASDTHLVNSTTSATTDFLYQTPSSRNNTPNNQEKQEPSSFQENKHSESLSFSNTSEFETSSSENNDDDLSAIAFMMNRSVEKQKGLKKSRKVKIKDFVDLQMRKLLERQEVWMGRMLKTIEDREQERMCREEEWTKREMARLDRIHELWAKERAWIEARDVALMEALKKYTGINDNNNNKTIELASSAIEEIAIATQTHYKSQDRNAKKIEIDIDEDEIDEDEINYVRWNEPEIFSLIQLRTAMESRFQESSGYSKESLWEEIAAKMASLGYDRSMEEIKEKWENMSMYFNMRTRRRRESNKKRKEDLRTSNYFHQLHPYNGQETAKIESLNSPSSSSFVGSSHVHGSSSSSCFQVPISGGEDLWNKYGLKPSKDKNHQHQL